MHADSEAHSAPPSTTLIWVKGMCEASIQITTPSSWNTSADRCSGHSGRWVEASHPPREQVMGPTTAT